MAGWIKLHREFLEWEWIGVPEMVSVWMYLLTTANHEAKRWQGIEVNPGQTIIGRKAMAETLGITERQVRTCLERLKTTNEIAIKTTNRFSLVTIVKWGVYQSDERKTTSKTTNKKSNRSQTEVKQTTTPKEDITKVISKNERMGEVIEMTHPLQKYIQENCPEVSKLKTQLTYQEAQQITDTYSKELIKETLEDMENKPGFAKNYIKVSTTLRNWIKVRLKSGRNQIDRKMTKTDLEKYMEIS